MNHTLNVRPVSRYKVKTGMGKEFRQLDFGTVPQNLQEEYLDMYEGIQSDIVSSSRFDDNSDISTTYLGSIESKEDQDNLKAEELFPISENGYTQGRLLDGTKCQLLLDTGKFNSTSKSFMSKSFYMQSDIVIQVNHYTPYQSLPPLHRKYRLGTVSALVCYL